MTEKPNDQWEPGVSGEVDPSRLLGRTSTSTSWTPVILGLCAAVVLGAFVWAVLHQ